MGSSANPRQSLQEVASEQLRDDILNQRLPPGTRLSEADLATRLGMSRTPVREALRVLMAEGLVRRDARGPTVASLTPSEVRDLLAVREVLDGLAASLAAERRDQPANEALQATLDRMGELLEQGRTRETAELDYRFHEIMARASGNPHTMEQLRLHYAQLHAFRLFSYALAGVPEQSHKQHQKIFRAIADGDSPRAEREARAHVRFVLRNIVDELGGSPVRW